MSSFFVFVALGLLAVGCASAAPAPEEHKSTESHLDRDDGYVDNEGNDDSQNDDGRADGASGRGASKDDSSASTASTDTSSDGSNAPSTPIPVYSPPNYHCDSDADCYAGNECRASASGVYYCMLYKTN